MAEQSKPVMIASNTAKRPSITVEVADDRRTLQVRGEVDLATAPTLAAALSDPESFQLLDLRQVSFIDCNGMSVLLDAADRAHASARRLTIQPSPAVQRVVRLLGLEHVLASPDAG